MLYTAILKPASGGFDMWEYSEYAIEEGCDSLNDMLGLLMSAGALFEKVPELNGCIYNQDCQLGFGIPIRWYFPDSNNVYDDENDFYTYCLAWEVEEDSEEKVA